MSKINREQFEAWGMSDTDLRITLECETYAGIAWLAWQAATNEAEAQLTALTSQLESVVAENAAMIDAVKETLAHWAAAEPGEMESMMDKCMPALRIAYCETPATSAFLAEVRASGVEMFAGEIGDYAKGKSPATAEIIKATGRNALIFAAQLRQGGAV